MSLSHIPRRTDNNGEALLGELAASRGSLETLGGLRDPRTTAAKWQQTLTVDFRLRSSTRPKLCLLRLSDPRYDRLGSFDYIASTTASRRPRSAPRITPCFRCNLTRRIRINKFTTTCIIASIGIY